MVDNGASRLNTATAAAQDTGDELRRVFDGRRSREIPHPVLWKPEWIPDQPGSDRAVRRQRKDGCLRPLQRSRHVLRGRLRERRDHSHAPAVGDVRERARRASEREADLHLLRCGARIPRNLVGARRRRGAVALAAIVGDRKSTRLNSSHVAISYAVFCLKKKKKKNVKFIYKKKKKKKKHIKKSINKK